MTADLPHPTPASPPESFVEQVRHALLNLYDPAALQTHPLTAHLDDAGGTLPKGRLLRQALLEAMAALQPAPGTPASARAGRLYRLLELRYLEGHDVQTVQRHLALSKSQYHREHQRALQAIATLLWERWHPPVRPADAPTNTGLVQQEVTQVLQSGAGHQPTTAPLAVLRSVVRLLQPLCQRRGVRLDLTTPATLPPIAGERSTLRHALLTLLAHAIARTTTPQVQIIVQTEPTTLTITIAGEAREPVTPTALGLPTASPLVTALGGTVATTLPPTPGPWSLRLTFPVSPAPLLLIVDNNPDFIRLVERFLEGTPWRTCSATQTTTARSLVREHRPDAILLDLLMPGRDGWDFLQALKASPATRTIPVIVCSVLDEPEVALSLGAAAYLQKPIDQRRLLTTLRAVVGPPPADTAGAAP